MVNELVAVVAGAIEPVHLLNNINICFAKRHLTAFSTIDDRYWHGCEGRFHCRIDVLELQVAGLSDCNRVSGDLYWACDKGNYWLASQQDLRCSKSVWASCARMPSTRKGPNLPRWKGTLGWRLRAV